MKRMFLLSALFCIIAISSAWGQRSLAIKDVSTSMNVFSGKDTEAGVVISCPANIELTFESTHDKTVDVYNTEQKGEETFYYIRFNTGKKYKGRRLTIMPKDYAPLIVFLDLSPKELKQYQLTDPDVEFVYGCYHEYRKRGTEYFQKAMYSEAKEQYSIAQECSDCPADANLEELIANVDSITYYRKEADNAYDVLNYTLADDYYVKVLLLNPLDSYAADRRIECSKHFSTDCTKYMDNASVYVNDGEYEKALELYQKVIEMNCSQTNYASEQAMRIQILLQDRKQRSHVIGYEYSKNAPVGITYGTYKKKKMSGYISFSLHPDMIHLWRKDYEEYEQAEVNISAGWTFNPVPSYPYGWLFFSFTGYTGTGSFVWEDGTPYVKGQSSPSSDEKEPKIKWHSAYSPEVGALVKVGPIGLRYTFQYRIAFKKEDKDFINKTRHVIGLCFCL